MAPQVLLHGAGVIGTAYAYLFSQGGCEVTTICRSSYSVAKDGFLVNSEKFGRGIRIKPAVVKTPTEAAASGIVFDHVVITAKVLPDTETAKLIKPAVTNGKTCIVLIQNGIGIEEEYRT